MSTAAKTAVTPTIVELELTSACNAACTFCPRHLFTKPDLMKRATFEKVVERVLETTIERVKLVGIGEPTLHPDAMWALGRLREAGLRPLLNTNGSRLHKLDPDHLLEVVDEIIVSLHTLDPALHREIFQIDVFDQVTRNLDVLLQANERHHKRITIYVVLTRRNPDAVAQITERYGDRVQLRVSGCTNRALGDFNEELIDDAACDAHNHYPPISGEAPLCGFATSAVAISARGDYLVCTNDVTRNSLAETVWTTSIPELTERIRAGLSHGDFLALCSQCDNYRPFREQQREQTVRRLKVLGQGA